MFSVSDRERLREWTLAHASSDPRVVAAAVVGSLAFDVGDRWSDLDLTFAVAAGESISAVLEDWTRGIVSEFDAIRLFDLPSGATIYRVFLLPGCLQFDLSFAPAADFGAIGPRFQLLWGEAVGKSHVTPQPPDELFGYAVHHALRARFCIERGRWWQAEYWVSGVRDYALSLACRRRGLAARYGRGYDDLPSEVREAFLVALVRSLDRDELLRALAAAIAGLLNEAHEVRDLATRAEPRLRELMEFR
jgi:hypothetical protein